MYRAGAEKLLGKKNRSRMNRETRSDTRARLLRITLTKRSAGANCCSSQPRDIYTRAISGRLLAGSFSFCSFFTLARALSLLLRTFSISPSPSASKRDGGRCFILARFTAGDTRLLFFPFVRNEFYDRGLQRVSGCTRVRIYVRIVYTCHTNGARAHANSIARVIFMTHSRPTILRFHRANFRRFRWGYSGFGGRLAAWDSKVSYLSAYNLVLNRLRYKVECILHSQDS